MLVYNLNLLHASSISQVALGNFSGDRKQEIFVARGSSLELLRPNPTTGKVHTLLTHEIFDTIRSLAPFRLTGTSKDYLVVGSNSGSIAILEYHPRKGLVECVHLETFGKTGSRRVVPGQYLATDPKGRAVMIAAVEKQKFVYILNRDTETNLTISSPLEAHRSHTIVFSCVALDVGFENPLFACLELDYRDMDDPSGPSPPSPEDVEKSLVYYELDLGLNHVVRKGSEPVARSAHHLIPLPGGRDGPSGVLVCSEGWVEYRYPHRPGVSPPIHRVPIPKHPNATPDRSVIINAASLHRMKTSFFILAQSDAGDLYRMTLDYELGEEGAPSHISRLSIHYFDPLPTGPAASMCILKSGFLFVAAEAGNHHLYQFIQLGDNDDEGQVTSLDPGLSDSYPSYSHTFTPRPMENLQLVEELMNLSPLVDLKWVHDHPFSPEQGQDESTEVKEPLMYALCGRGPRSSFRILRRGLQVSELATSDLPGYPRAVWTSRLRRDDQYDAYIIVSFTNATLVLSIGDSVEEVTDSGFLGDTSTLHVQQMGEAGIVQIHPRGIRHVTMEEDHGGRRRRIHEWNTPGNRSVVKATANSQQAVLALSGGEVVYFQLDPISGQLQEHPERMGVPSNVSCLAIGPIREGQLGSTLLAIGCDDRTVRMVSLDPADCLQQRSVQAVAAQAHSLRMIDMIEGTGEEGQRGDRVQEHEEDGSEDQVPVAGLGVRVQTRSLYLHIGLTNGVLLSTVVDDVSGELRDTRTRFLGGKPVELVPIHMEGSQGVLALSSRPWLSYTGGKGSGNGGVQLSPLALPSPSSQFLEGGSNFESEQCPEGLVGISGRTLRIMTIEDLGGRVHETLRSPLSRTPRASVILDRGPGKGRVIVVEMDQEGRKGRMSSGIRIIEPRRDVDLGKGNAPKGKYSQGSGNREEEEEEEEEDEEEEEIEVDRTVHLTDLPLGEGAVSITLMRFDLEAAGGGALREVGEGEEGGWSEDLLVIGTITDGRGPDEKQPSGSLLVYRLSQDASQIELLHRTSIGVAVRPLALLPFHGRLVVGAGLALRVYALGRKKLLRKCESRSVSLAGIVRLSSPGGRRILVGDLQGSARVILYYETQEMEGGPEGGITGRMALVSEEATPRWTSALASLDWDSAVGGDKFGDIFVTRMDRAWSGRVDTEPATVVGTGASRDRPLMTPMIQFHLGDAPVISVTKTPLVPGGRDVLAYATFSGLIGVLIPVGSKEDGAFLQALEAHVREVRPALCGRNVIAWRGAYTPSKGVVDGEMCEIFGALRPVERESIAESLDRTVAQVTKRLEDLRALYAF